MEPFASGKISATAKFEFLHMFPVDAGSFTRVRGGYVMHAPESRIAVARALGRGNHSGRGKRAHRFDVTQKVG